MAISFHALDVSMRLLHRRKLRLLLQNLFAKEKVPLESLTYVFCSDAHLLEINRQFLKHDYFTDIITFDLSDGRGPVVGEIYISVDRVRENAKSFDSRFQEELRRVIIHGALHLCGQRDKTAAQQKAMRKAENKYLRLFDPA